MNKTRQLALLTVVAVVAVVAGGWLLLISPQRSKVTDLRNQAAQQQTKNATLSTEIDRLKAESKDTPAEQARLAAVAEQLPANPAMPALINDLSTAAKKAGVDLQVISPSTPAPFESVLGTTAGSMTLSATPSPSASASSSTSSSSTSSSTSSTSSSTSSTTTATSLSGAQQSGLYQIPIELTAVGSYFQLTQFLNQIENLKRAYLVTALDLKPGDPLATSASTTTAGTTSTSGSSGDYSGALTAKVDGFIFEVLTQTPTATQTLPSTTSGQ